MPRRLPVMAPLLVACLGPGLPLQAREPGPAAADGEQVCARISAFPDAADPERFLRGREPGLVPAVDLPVIGSFPLMIPAPMYPVLFLLVWVLRNGLPIVPGGGKPCVRAAGQPRCQFP